MDRGDEPESFRRRKGSDRATVRHTPFNNCIENIFVLEMQWILKFAHECLLFCRLRMKERLEKVQTQKMISFQKNDIWKRLQK